MTNAIVPYSFDTDFVPTVQPQATLGQVQGVYITLHPDALETSQSRCAAGLRDA